MTRMNKGRTAISWLLLAALALAGCSLAEEGTDETGGDTLIGVFVTKEALDLFDIEAYLTDNLSTAMDGGEISAGDAEKYGGRLYAEKRTVTLTGEEQGETAEHIEYVFAGLEGIPFFYTTVTMADGERYTSLTSGENMIQDAHITVGEETTLEGTIYFVPGKIRYVHINPVYQSADGRVYLTSGSGIGMDTGGGEEGSFSQTLTETHTVTADGEVTEKHFQVSVRIAPKYAAVRTRVVQIGADNMPVADAAYAPGALPAVIDVDARAAYIIVETTVDTGAGESIRYALLGKDDGALTAYVANENGIYEGETAEVRWG